MKSLQKEIQRVELELERNRYTIHRDYNSIKHRITTTKFLSLALLGSFAIGYLFSRNKGKIELILAASTTLLTARRMSEKVKLLFPTRI